MTVYADSDELLLVALCLGRAAEELAILAGLVHVATFDPLLGAPVSAELGRVAVAVRRVSVEFGELAAEVGEAAAETAVAAEARAVLGEANDLAPAVVTTALHEWGWLLPLADPLVTILPEGAGRADRIPTVAVPPPSTVAAAFEGVGRLAPGQVAIVPVLGTDGVTRYVVELRGIEPSLDAGVNATVNTVQQAIKGSRERSDAYTRAVIRALAEAGVRPGADIMLVGHSQGGIAAIALAGTPRLPYRITHVVTAGAPVGNKATPDHVRVLEIENSRDVVPELDGMQDRSRAGRDVVTIPGHGGLVGDGGAPTHEIATGYLPGLRSVAFSCTPQVRSFVDSAGPYLTGLALPARCFRLTEGAIVDGPQLREVQRLVPWRKRASETG